MSPFSYAVARDMRAAQDFTASGRGAMFVAGGTDMLQLLQDDVVRPDTLVDITHLPISGARVDADGARIGAMARLTEVADDEAIQRHYPMLVQALRETASPQVRNMATMGGNLLQRTRCLYFRDSAAPCNKRAPGSGCGAYDGQNRMNAILGGSDQCIAAYPGDLAVVLVALDASVQLHGPNGERHVRVEDLHRLPADRPDVDTGPAAGRAHHRDHTAAEFLRWELALSEAARPGELRMGPGRRRGRVGAERQHRAPGARRGNRGWHDAMALVACGTRVAGTAPDSAIGTGGEHAGSRRCVSTRRQ